MKKRIKIQGFLIFCVLAIAILMPKFLFAHWEKEALDEFLDALGMGVVLFGFLFRIAARGYKAEISANGRCLVKDGPYGLIRHPMYFGTLLIGLGIVLALFKWWAFPVFFIVCLLIYIPQIQREENKLYASFGAEYQNYCKTVPKYFLNIINLFKVDFRDYLFFKRAWIKKEFSSLVGITALIIAIEAREDVRLFGRQEFIKELLELSLIAVFFIIALKIFHTEKDASDKSKNTL